MARFVTNESRYPRAIQDVPSGAAGQRGLPRGRPRRPFLASLDPTRAADSLLREGLDQATEAKRVLRQQLLRLDPTGQVATPRPAPAQHQVKPAAQREAVTVAANADEKARAATEDDEIQLTDPFCETTYDAIRRLTTMIGRARVRCPAIPLAPLLDPRAWSCGGGVIAAAL
jgi:hypothetical protein